MKLDESVIDKILKLVDEGLDAYEPFFNDEEKDIREPLRKLNLVFKPGDSSQSVLVENRK